MAAFWFRFEADGITAVVIEFDGKAVVLNPEPVVATTLVGLLGPAMEPVNMVNAAAVASSNGIAVSTVRHDRQCDYETLLRVSISHKSSDRTIAGTLVGGNKLRIVEVQHIAVGSDFPRHLLYLRNYDKPGLVGDLGSLFGKHGINIATLHLGRREAGGEAIALVEIDGGLPKTMLPEIRALDQVVRADALHFALDI